MSSESSLNIRTQLGAHALLGKGGEVSAQDLEGKIIGLYFSAHWCPPCRQFTPLLVKKYEEINATSHKFEIIFVSGDRDEAACMSYYESMPWLVLNYAGKGSVRQMLREKYHIAGIPSLVLIDANGELISVHGRQLIMSAPFDKLKEAEEERAQSWCTIS